MIPVVDCRRRLSLWKLSAVAVFTLAAIIAQLLSTSPALSQQPEPQSANHAALVKQIGDDRYAVREQAARTLLEAGESAQTALRAGLADEDPQRRRSCRRILAQVASATVRQRLDSVNPDELPGIEWMSELPGWDRYARIIGTDRSSRQLFLDMQKQEPALFASLEDPEGYLLEQARRILGEEIPFVTSLDLHGILTDRMLTHNDAVVIYHTQQFPARCF